MNQAEILRLACYAASAPAFLLLAFHSARQHDWWHSVMYAALSLLFSWYMIEISMAATGLNTREYRIIGTPMVVGISSAACILAAQVAVYYWHIFRMVRGK